MTGLDAAVSEGLVARDVSIRRLTTYKLGGPARWFAEVGDADELERVLAAWRADRPPILVLGRGSNLVVADRGFDGLVLRLGRGFSAIEHRPDRIVAGGAVPLPVLARSAVSEGRLGLEFYVGIPGSMGGAVRQNAGCLGSETVDVLIAAEIVDGDGIRRRVGRDELGLSYRHSDVAADQVVVSAELSFAPGPVADGERRVREVTRWRKEHQPGGTLNAGSVFKNPTGDSAGRLIDAAGLKGFAVGGASVSERHANFFVATREATAADVHRLVAEVQERVAASWGIRLEPEICFAGDFGGDL
jgi:UDP-N-acetylmuramate dehydrogenase